MASTQKPEIWGGLESTINRVRDQWHDQSARNGHNDRIEDIDLFAQLGITKLRYPLLWEKSQIAEGQFNFEWVRARLERLWGHGIEPIATLLQHGSGPEDTSLIDPEFPWKLARYAKAVAENFPELRMYTPVNEPFTTARFSGLYGVWYPHGRSNETMLKALLNECKGVILAMREIRKINPQALLVQTEDLGKASGTDVCEDMVDFQNQRRWISFDLLCGRIDRRHPLRSWMLENGVTHTELDWFVKNPCPPDILGINHYPLSNRFLDHRFELYPSCFHGEQSGFKFADTSKVQIDPLYPDQDRARLIPPMEILREAIDRYRIPLAVTEVHISGNRESQMQWLNEIWKSACQLKEEGADVVAITPWSLLGSFDWNTLCSMGGSFYESGVFDIRSRTPRPTSLARMIRELSERGTFEHPVLENPGYWHNPSSRRGAPLLITGANGTLGKAFHRVAEARGLASVCVGRSEMDVTSLLSVRELLESIRPWAVINTAGYVRVDQAEQEPDKAFLSNVIGSEILASECRRLQIPYVTFSSDLVFDGSKETRNASDHLPYTENDPTRPLSVYGQTKAEMETRVLGLHPESLIIRTSSFFSPWDKHNFAVHVVENLRQDRPMEVTSDVVMAPTYVPSLTNACLDLLIDGDSGITHLANRGEVSWSEFAREIASLFDLDHQLIRPKKLEEFGWPAARPLYSALSSGKLQIMPSLEEDLWNFKQGDASGALRLFDMKAV